MLAYRDRVSKGILNIYRIYFFTYMYIRTCIIVWRYSHQTQTTESDIDHDPLKNAVIGYPMEATAVGALL